MDKRVTDIINNNIKNLFRELECNNIDYVLLSDFDDITLSKDIDLYIESEHKEKFHSVLEKLDWKKRLKSADLNNHFYYAYVDQQEIIWLDVKYSLEFICGKNIYLYKEHENIFKERYKNINGIYRPSIEKSIILYAAHIAFCERGDIEKRHLVALSRYVDEYIESVTGSYSEDILNIKKLLKNEFNIDFLREKISENFIVSKNKTIVKFNKNIGKGFIVVFIGPDGAGKSTVISLLDDKLGVKKTKLYLGEKKYFFKLSEAMSKQNFKNKYMNILSNIIYRYIALPVDIFLRVMRIYKISRYRVVLIDRIPGFPFVSKNKLLKNIYSAIVPKPDLMVLLYGDGEKISKRKNEASKETISQDINKFKKVMNYYSSYNCMEIDTVKLSIEETCNQIMRSIYSNPIFLKKIFQPIK